MSDLLAIVGPAETDDELVAQIAHHRPRRVTVLVEEESSNGADWALDDSDGGQALRERIATLLHEIEAHTGAAVVGLVADEDQLVGWRFDCVVRPLVPIAA